MLIRGAEVQGCRRDVRIAGELVVELGAELAPRPGESAVEARGGALLPGLHDHHLHLLAWAAARDSLACGPPAVRDRRGLARALRAASPLAGWVRAVGYHESVAGALDRAALDRLLPNAALRLQHRSGALWLLNSLAVKELGLDAGADAPGVERDAAGRATGRLFRLDAWLRERLPPASPPDLAALSSALGACGVSGVTDATPGNGPRELALFAGALARGELRQRLVLMGGRELPSPAPGGALTRGALKLLLEEDRLPDFDALVALVVEAHAAGRPVAMHCVTRAELVLAVAAFAGAGAAAGDRVEHASLAPPELLAQLRALPLTVVTQPNFVAERGDAYRAEVEPREHSWLYRCRSFLEAGVALGAGTDAPFGAADPWAAMRAAVERRTAEGHPLGEVEALTPEQALALFTTPAEAPGGAPRRVAVGERADLCLLDAPWAEAREQLARERVRATWTAGVAVHGPS